MHTLQIRQTEAQNWHLAVAKLRPCSFSRALRKIGTLCSNRAGSFLSNLLSLSLPPAAFCESFYHKVCVRKAVVSKQPVVLGQERFREEAAFAVSTFRGGQP